MTVFAWASGRRFPELPEPEARLIRTAPDTQVLARCFWQPDRAGVPTLLALHGLEGSSEAHYMRGLAAKAWQRGWNAVLLNQRNCGGTEHLTPGLYHSGLTDDPKAVIRALVRDDRLPCVGVVGYSLGGNLTIKLAGELDDAPDLPVVGVAAISPTIDLELSSGT
jgi:predicted alpha/beta-fold hydrolase